MQRAKGQTLRQRTDRLRNLVRILLPAGSALRKDLYDGRIVIRRRGATRSYEAVVAGEEGTQVDLWLHVGLPYLSPVRSTWHGSKPIEDLDELPHDSRRLYVERRR